MDEEMMGFGFHKVKTADDEHLRIDGCIDGKNYIGVQCTARDKCYKCGWNPRIAAQRKYKRRQEMKDD